MIQIQILETMGGTAKLVFELGGGLYSMGGMPTPAAGGFRHGFSQAWLSYA